ncbi:translation initiation factor [Spirochaetota bacterium]
MKDKIVYSSELGDLRKKQNKKKSHPSNKNQSSVTVRKEKKGRGGKTVSIVYGLPLTKDGLSLFAKRLKQKLGTGGAVKDRNIIIQGDKTDKIIQFVKEEGYNIKC